MDKGFLGDLFDFDHVGKKHILKEETIMDWMDFNRDGEVDATEEFLGTEMLCSSREEHEALFGDAGDFREEVVEDEEDELEMAGLNPEELEFMNEDERREVLEDAGLDPDDFDF